MTISTTIIKNSYSGDGSQTVFPYSFKINAEADIQVIIRAANGTETVKSLTTDYTVSGVGSASGGNVTMVTAPTATETLVIRRETTQTQTVDLVENDPFTAETVEGAFDKSIAVSQELQEEVDRSIKLSRTNTMTSTEFTVDAATRANKILAFDSSGEISVTQELGTYQGNWAASTAYNERDLVKDTSNNNIYLCNTAHTSSGSQPISTNTDVAKWDLIVDAASATTSASAAAASATAAASSATAAASSASAAATSETNAGTSETNAASSATSAATSASNASTSETNAASSATAAATSETNAATSETNAATSATNAATSATNAATSASNASTSETNAAASATTATTQASAASTSASNAATSATNASSSATSAASSATAAQTAQTAAEAALDSFDDTYLGAKASDPSVDNDGDPLNAGDTYYDTTNSVMKVYNGSSWDAIQTGITDVAPTRHSIRPSLNLDFANSKVLDPRITFTRGSNATYYDGYTSVKAEENLSYPSIPDNTWSATRVNLTTNNATAPDGTNTATLITLNSGSSTTYYLQSDNTTNTSQTEFTTSIFAKAGTHNFVQLWVNSQSSFYANFDLSTGTVGTTAGGVTTSITDVGNSWYRISMTFTSNGQPNAPFIAISFQNSSSDGRVALWSATGTETVYLWGGQSEIRDTVTAYTPTTSSPITKYQPALQTAGNNVARFDHNPTTGESLGLLIEEQRTNLIDYSEDFSQWTTFSSTLTSDIIIAPDGTQTGYQMFSNTDTNIHGVRNTLNFTSGNSYTFSVFAKQGTQKYLVLSLPSDAFSTEKKGGVDLENGLLITGSDSSTQVTDVGNGWYRVSISATATSTVASNPTIYLNDADDITVFITGSDTDNLFIWGAQVEEGSFPTSYIKTTGSQVTRSADDCEMLNIDQDDWLKQGAGTLYGEFSKPYVGQENGTTRYASAFALTNDQFDTNSIRVYVEQSTSPRIQSNILTTNTSQGTFILISPAVADTYYKTAIAYETNNFDSSGNGSDETTDTSNKIPFINRLRIFKRISYQSGGNYGTIKKLSYYPIKLTKNEVIDLTEE